MASDVLIDDLLEFAHDNEEWAMLKVAFKFLEGSDVARDENLACEWVKKYLRINLDTKNYENISLVSGVYEREKLLPGCQSVLIDTYSLVYKENPIIGNYLFGRSAYYSGKNHTEEAIQRLELSANEGHAISTFLLYRIRAENHKGILKRILSIYYGALMTRILYAAKKQYGEEAFICWKDWFLKSKRFKRIFIDRK